MTIKHTCCIAVFIGWLGLGSPSVTFSDSETPQGKIAFVRGDFADRQNRKIWICKADGTDLHPLTKDGKARGEDGPSWSPGGKMIAFAALRGNSSRICVRGANGKNERCLTSDLPDRQDYSRPA